MNLNRLASRVFGWLFGAGFSAEIISRAAVFLVSELRGAMTRADEPVTKVRLQPGETYTVIAYPRPTRKERRLTNKQRALAADFTKRSRPTRSQLRKVRKLSRIQRRVDRTRPGGRRHEKWSAKEVEAGISFDRAMRPTRKQVASAQALDDVTRQLNGIRSQRFDAARRSGRPRRSVKLYD